jgi:DNA-binding CsgD family transcriptional regulator
MRSNPLTRVFANAYEAAVSPELWPSALEAVTSHVGAAGAAYIVLNNENHQVDWACFSGPSVEMKGDYVRHYATLDPYSPLLTTAPPGKWLALSNCLPDTVLQSDEWYNDFVRKSGVCDILGVRLLDTSTHTVIFGVHQENGQGSFTPANVAALEECFAPLSKAAGLHVELHALGLKSGVAGLAFGILAAGVIITESNGRIIEMNPAAEQIVRRHDGLLVRNGKIGLHRVAENEKLEALLAAAAAGTKSNGTIGHMLVARHSHRSAYALTVASLSPELTHSARPLAMLVVAEPAASQAKPRDDWGFTETIEAPRRTYSLTLRERQVMTWVARGKTAWEIGEILHITKRTADQHVHAAARKLAAANRTQAVAIAIRSGIIEVDT